MNTTTVATVNVISFRGHLEVQPERVEVCPDSTVTLRFRNGVPPGSARTKQVGTGASWLNVETTDKVPDLIVLEVPKEARRGTEFKYVLEVDEIGMLDPVIVIR
ncbi:MAG: hypothetical protein A3I78_05415 [Gammaproteobacteria bacterium RIFCSPLOWO2_02_FULL_56_15]|nr:MAG: hypothetical protein A3I78_05415 [Gammaproteobacteria bacterium RIFCSPLOWO2_02_FULL_56_15]